MKSLLSESAIILAILTAFLYCIGTAHFYGFLNALNTDPYIIDRSFDQVIYYGALILLNNFLKYVVDFIVIFILWYLAYVSSYFRVDWTIKGKKRLIRLRKICRRLALPRVASLKNSIAVAVSFIAIVFILSAFQNIGKTAAHDLVDQIRNKKYNDLRKITVNLNSSNIELFRVACGSSRCLGIDAKNLQVDVFSMSDIQHTKLIVK